MKVLVLLSGGIDSAVVLASLSAQHDCEAVCYDYGQPHSIEIRHAEKIAHYYKVPFSIKALPAIPLVNEVMFAARNFVLVADAVAYAMANKFDVVAFGCNQSDWMHFPDCRPLFWSAVKACTETYNVVVSTPLLYSFKRDIVMAAKKLGVPLEMTWSCYDPDVDKPCGVCLACTTREEAMRQT